MFGESENIKLVIRLIRLIRHVIRVFLCLRRARI